jgi:DNA-binding CsgD family transcriptional regulator
MNWKSLLTPREVEVVQCLVQGRTDKEIADHLGLSPHTVKNHLFRIFDKLGVSSRVELLFLTISPDAPPDEAGVTVKKPTGPKLGRGSAAASLDDEEEGPTYDRPQALSANEPTSGKSRLLSL